MKPYDLLNILWRGGQYSYYWTTPDKKSHWFSVTHIERPPNGNRNVYFGVNPVTAIPSTNARGKKCDRCYVRSQNDYIGAINTVFSEFDRKDFGSDKAIFDHLEKFPSPSVTIFSGGGYHLYWLLDRSFIIESEAGKERARQIQANWVDYTGSDKQSKDLSRVLRVPGTKNYKKRYAPNFPTVEIIEATSELYSLAHLEELSRPEPQPEPPKVSIPKNLHCTNTDREWYANHALSVAGDMVRQSVDGEKHGTLLRAARLLGGYIAGGIVCEQTAISLLEQEIGYKANVESLRQAYRTIQDGIKYGKAEPITLEQKVAEREYWKQQQQMTPSKPNGDRRYWSRQFEGYWERVR